MTEESGGPNLAAFVPFEVIDDAEPRERDLHGEDRAAARRTYRAGKEGSSRDEVEEQRGVV